MLELLIIIVPVLFCLIWWLGYQHIKSDNLSSFKTFFHPQANIRSLFNETSDKDLEAILQQLPIDARSVETHMILAQLFRERGEVERAIRIHQNIIARPEFNSRPIKNDALLELGRDYLRAGLYDRAETILHELIDHKRLKRECLQELLTIYEKTKDWQRAIRAANHLAQCGQTEVNQNIAHYYCELACGRRNAGDIQAAQTALQQALSADYKSVRVSIEEAELNIARQHYQEAYNALRRVSRQDIEFVAETIPLLRVCLQQLDNIDNVIAYCEDCLTQQVNGSLVVFLCELIAQHENQANAQAVLVMYLGKAPSLRGLHYYVSQQSVSHQSLDGEEDFLQRQLNTLLAKEPRYLCRSCGFKGKSLFWHCPSCDLWGEIKPL